MCQLEKVETEKVITSRTGEVVSRRKFDAPFIAWDGEGVTVNGRHTYVYLANSLGGSITNLKGITHQEAFEFFLQTSHENPWANHVAYVHSYDANMILGDVPLLELFRIYDGTEADDGTHVHYVNVGDYRVRYFARRSLYVQRRVRKARREPFILWDVSKFFQCSFVDALRKYFGAHREIDAIAEMKAKRSQFAPAQLDDVGAYCALELKWLTMLMDRVRSGLDRAEIHVRRWDGSGAIAGALMQMHKVKEHLRPIPEAMQEAVACAYGGGRIDAPRIGYTQRAYVDDLTSAYPWALTALPSLAGGEWKNYKAPGAALELVKISWSFPPGLPWYPLFYRTKTGSILYPPRGESWVWSWEASLAFAFAEQFGGHGHVSDTWSFVPGSNVQPFSFIHGLYDLRQRWKEKKNPAESILKFGMSSLYGKLASQLGGTKKNEPPYFQLALAGAVASMVRAQLGFRALQVAPQRIMMFATDGLFIEGSPSRAGAHHARVGTPELGTWQTRDLAHLIVAQPGIYWSMGAKGDWEARSRGFDKSALATPDSVLQAWSGSERSIEVPSTRFVTLGSALLSPERFTDWRRWITEDRVLAIDGNSAKRVPMRPEYLADCAGATVPLQVREARDYELFGTPSAAFPVDFWEIEAAQKAITEEETEEMNDRDDVAWT